MRKILISESQYKMLINEFKNVIDFLDDKKKIIISFLKKNFIKGETPKFKNGDIHYEKIAIRVDKHGQPITEMQRVDLTELLRDKFKNILSDTSDRDELIEKCIDEWYFNK